MLPCSALNLKMLNQCTIVCFMRILKKTSNDVIQNLI